MDKKPLIIISLCAVVLLVLSSLSNVVGYQSVKSTVNDSPLFQTRTQRATNQQQNIITSQYIGMGKKTLLQFSILDNKTEQMKKAINIISRMNDKSFLQFTKLCILQARQDNAFNNINSIQIIQTLNLLRTKPEIILNLFTNIHNQGFTEGSANTLCNWVPGCIFAMIYFTLLFSVIAIAIILIIPLLIYVYIDTYTINHYHP